MTQKQKQQKDYDKAFCAEWESYCEFVNYNDQSDAEQDAMSGAFQTAFYIGYEYGRKARSEEVNLVLIADGEPYATARERAIQKGFFAEIITDFKTAYRQGWNDADSFDEAWIQKHPGDLRERLDDYPEIIDEIKRETIAEMRKKAKENEDAFASDHFRDPAKMMRAEFAKAAMGAILTRDINDEWVNLSADSKKSIGRLIAEESVNLADALIAELERREEPWPYSEKSR